MVLDAASWVKGLCRLGLQSCTGEVHCRWDGILPVHDVGNGVVKEGITIDGGELVSGSRADFGKIGLEVGKGV